MTYMPTHQERDIVRQVAGLVIPELSKLGHDYTADTSEAFADHRGVYLDVDGSGQQRLFLSLDWKNHDRLVIRGCYPHGTYNVTRVEHHEIGVKRDRGPAVIAREIVRRLLPEYTADLDRVINSLVEHQKAREARKKVADELAYALNGSVRDETADSTSTEVSFYHNERGYGSAHVRYRADKVDLDLHGLPADLAHIVVLAIHDYQWED